MPHFAGAPGPGRRRAFPRPAPASAWQSDTAANRERAPLLDWLAGIRDRTRIVQQLIGWDPTRALPSFAEVMVRQAVAGERRQKAPVQSIGMISSVIAWADR